ncbi:MAG TPA: SDR family oxidoreductase [Armatimonadota bacterium]|nr:SDR family oxidoreductase [Armatimonadota bacterium]HOS43979.1 SDR family oxidoreductase [Armatimonadota bacterium]
MTHRTGQTALITGAGRGIGRAIAVALARLGLRLALTARTSDGLEATAALARAEGAAVSTITADLADPAAPAYLVAETVAAFGALDVLVNNAGVLLVKPFAATTMEDFDRLLAVNLRAPFALAKAALPYLSARGAGAIINIASAAGKRFYADQSAYCASKHGLLGMNKVLAAELRPLGIRVHAVCPGGVATEMTTGQRPDWHPENLMAPEDIAAAVVYLLSLSPRATVDELPIRRIAADPLWG